MDSLLANYGSDEEDGNSPPGSPKPTVLTTSAAPAPIWNRQSLFGALPPPKNSASELSSLWDDEEPVKPLRKSSGDNNPERTAPLTTPFFTSLPPPKNSALETSSLWDDEEPLKRPKSAADRDTDPQQPATPRSLFTSVPPIKVENVWGEPLEGSAGIPKLEPVGDEKVRKRQTGSLPSALLSPKLEPVTLPEGFFDNPGPLSDSPPPKDDTTEGKPSLLFARLPPPASSSRPSFAKLPLPSTTKRKQVVEFKPPINHALLETTEEDDELERSKKQSKLSKESDGAPERKAGVGLIALLPLPKNTLGAGAALGGGNSHGGRRTVMETASDPYRMANEVTSTSGSIPQTVKRPEPNTERPPTGIANYEYGIEPAVQSSESYHYSQPDGGHYDPHLAQPLYAPSHSGNDGYSVGNGYVEKNWQNRDLNAFEVSQGQGNAPVHVLADVMKKERRKGRDEPPPQMIEVKQADLTGGSKLREDQMRSTGIAFGPTYKPAASNKDKPSKIHRRKHQIGALYFDMKQNEMNLLDRRAKGNLTKAETQAKYGW